MIGACHARLDWVCDLAFLFLIVIDYVDVGRFVLDGVVDGLSRLFLLC